MVQQLESQVSETSRTEFGSQDRLASPLGTCALFEWKGRVAPSQTCSMSYSLRIKWVGPKKSELWCTKMIFPPASDELSLCIVAPTRSVGLLVLRHEGLTPKQSHPFKGLFPNPEA